MSVTSGETPSTPWRAEAGLSWTFRLSGEQVSVTEQQQFQTDLEKLGVTRAVWDVFNSVLETGTRYSRPLALRVLEADVLIGLALVYECRRTGECFFDPPYSSIMDLTGTPSFLWLRYGITIDNFSNPGFVADGVDRNLFVERCVSFLLREYLYGTLVEYRDSPVLAGAVQFPFPDSGVIDLAGMSSIEDYIGRSKNLSRKLKKFRNKGGEILTVEGVMPDELRAAALDSFNTLNVPIRTPFQDNFLNMAEAGMSSNASGKVHIVALLDGAYAGYQSFCHSGNFLLCQAGAFDRSRNSTYHAYENIIVESVEYAMRHDIDRVDFGPITNESKAKMMTGFIPCENRAYARYRPIAVALPYVLKRSKIAPERLARWCDLGEYAESSFS